MSSHSEIKGKIGAGLDGVGSGDNNALSAEGRMIVFVAKQGAF